MRLIAVALLAALAAASPAAAKDWTVDPAQSQLGFTARFGGEPFSGTFKSWTATIVFDPADLAASSILVTVDMTSADTGDATRDDNLVASDWFAASQFPTAIFQSQSISETAPGQYEAAGTLTIRDVSRPLTLPFRLTLSDGTATAGGSVVILRNEFGVGQGQWSVATPIPHEVTVTFAITAS
ncbi:MAG: polyisoprenoid-binding protein [Alphaproteobacteria bacterium]|nr:polyisoprenoid-binding protein [Alphaproteobacteria bacterium]